MTTIAYRAGVLAGDTRVTSGDLVLPEHPRKVYRFRDGRLFGACGHNTDATKLRIAMVKGDPAPKLNTINALMIALNGSIWFYESGSWERVDGDYAAIGTGAVYALGAFYMGATARQAVRAGCKLDTMSGGRIHVVELRG